MFVKGYFKRATSSDVPSNDSALRLGVSLVVLGGPQAYTKLVLQGHEVPGLELMTSCRPDLCSATLSYIPRSSCKNLILFIYGGHTVPRTYS